MALWTKCVLFGVDDPEALRAIRLECERRAYPKGALHIFGLVMFPTIALSIAAIRLSGLSAYWWASWLLFPAITLPVFMVTVPFIMRAKMDKVLPDVLQDRGRCINCGYRLNTPAADACPECGTPTEHEG